MFGRALAVWLALVALAVLNGGCGSSCSIPWIGERSGHVASTILLCLVILLAAWLAILWIGARTDEDALRVGLLWLVLTVVFEFLAGHYRFGNSWKTLLADYKIAACHLERRERSFRTEP